jgi:ClpP class serine protease
LIDYKFDPLKKEGIRPEDEQYLIEMHDSIFTEFKDWVIKNRDEKLNSEDPDKELFQANVFNAKEA